LLFKNNHLLPAGQLFRIDFHFSIQSPPSKILTGENLTRPNANAATAPLFVHRNTHSICLNAKNTQAGLSAVLAKKEGMLIKRAQSVD
jgi:hypothetical protein